MGVLSSLPWCVSWCHVDVDVDGRLVVAVDGWRTLYLPFLARLLQCTYVEYVDTAMLAKASEQAQPTPQCAFCILHSYSSHRHSFLEISHSSVKSSEIFSEVFSGCEGND